MATTDAISGTGAAQYATKSGEGVGGSTGLGDNFDNFLTLLTTQLQNQDPLSPMDSTQFTDQLATFSQVEQSMKSNTLLEQLVEMQGNGTTEALDYIGKMVEGQGKVVTLDGEGGTVPFSYEVPEDSDLDEVTIKLLDEDGKTVRTFDGETDAGRHKIDWNGLDDQGNDLAAGDYTIQVAATDQVGDEVSVPTYVFGEVTGVETVNGEVHLTVGGATVPVSTVENVAVKGDSDTSTDDSGTETA